MLLLLLVIEKWSKEQLANRARRYKKTPMIGGSHGIQCGGKDGEGQPGGGNVLETLLSLILSEKAGINISGDASTSRPLEDFIQNGRPWLITPVEPEAFVRAVSGQFMRCFNPVRINRL